MALFKRTAAVAASPAALLFLVLLFLWAAAIANEVRPERKPSIITNTWRKFHAWHFGYQFLFILITGAAINLLCFVQ
jgi:hypothetical protein